MRNTAVPDMCYHAEFGRSRSNGWCVITEIIPKKIDPSRPIFQGHSRSLERTRNSATYDFLLVFHSNYRPILVFVHPSGRLSFWQISTGIGQRYIPFPG